MFEQLIMLLERNQKIKNLSPEQKEKFADKIADVQNGIKLEKKKLNWVEEFFGDNNLVCKIRLPFKNFNLCDDMLNVLALDDWKCDQVTCHLKSKQIEFVCNKI